MIPKGHLLLKNHVLVIFGIGTSTSNQGDGDELLLTNIWGSGQSAEIEREKMNRS